MLEIKNFLEYYAEELNIGLFKTESSSMGKEQFLAGTASGSTNNLSAIHLNDKKWTMGFLGYDLKNSLEALRTRHLPGILFPDVHFFKPEKIHRINSEKSFTQDKIAAGKKIQIKCRMDKRSYIESIRRIQWHILRGDIYELNFCIEFFAEDFQIDPINLFLRLHERSASPYANFIKTGNTFLIGASPERFLKKNGPTLISQPMKGTAPRGQGTEEDDRLINQLRSDQKETAENIMITDLVRNDLSRVAIPRSVKVRELCKVETFKTAHQLVSTIACQTDEAVSFENIIKATFPMGSMTGAPKISSMKLIDQYELRGRGLYSGCAGYITPEGDFDFSVVIRSILYDAEKKYLSFSVGSAITAASDPASEYAECMIKARAMFEVLGGDFTKFA